MKKSYKTIEELFKDVPWRTPSKFIPIAKRYGFTDTKAIRDFLSNKVIHDAKAVKPTYLPIFSQEPGGYQMDLIFDGKKVFLFCININTRKGYVYSIKSKKTKDVYIVINKFISEVSDVKSIMSDQDSTFLSQEILSFIKSKNISYRTTEDNNHNVLGIINRFVRTIRDFTQREDLDLNIMEAVDKYNDSPHESLNGKCPNEITDEMELDYIAEKMALTNEIKHTYNLKVGDRVRVFLDKNKIGKNSSNLSKVSYIISEVVGNQYLIRSKDGSVDKYPGYKLYKCSDNIPIANTIKNDKRGVIEKIISYDENTNKYKVQFDDDKKTIDIIPAKNLREGTPARLSQMERDYWSKHIPVPSKISKWI